MPKDVNRAGRLNDIADATIRVARNSGAHAVTIRSVARELGGSTTLVTNYLPSRAGLILNVLDRASEQWNKEYVSLARTLSPLEQFEELICWSPTPDEAASVFRTLILEIVANADTEPVLRRALQRESRKYRDELYMAAVRAGFIDPQLAADTGYLLLRGVYFANAEDPEYWTTARMREVAIATVRALPRQD
ncbi:TetR/AcrR family transcriptional regulator [Arthrobacter sp. ISL-95]|uniref:TetR/AcrR family transcriptional regulator n=1 Tax=Arthrobacter sp. ISL-95 TaxID=2819116 RepID=UPI001BE6281C|nr:TetR/AcrR family transcriptional regulator [Arthrobacter sp. ISL-95]MBT2588512.1 TetR/AcrR family transcriptional regulator [Arthrobacter sp. ISL-95]